MELVIDVGHNLESGTGHYGVGHYGGTVLISIVVFFFLMGDGLLKVQRMGTSPFHSPKVSAHKKLSAVV